MPPLFRRPDGVAFVVGATGAIYEVRRVELTVAQLQQGVAAGLLTSEDEPAEGAPPSRGRTKTGLTLLRGNGS